jgi:hypothetical protein
MVGAKALNSSLVMCGCESAAKLASYGHPEIIPSNTF